MILTKLYDKVKGINFLYGDAEGLQTKTSVYKAFLERFSNQPPNKGFSLKPIEEINGVKCINKSLMDAYFKKIGFMPNSGTTELLVQPSTNNVPELRYHRKSYSNKEIRERFEFRMVGDRQQIWAILPDRKQNMIYDGARTVTIGNALRVDGSVVSGKGTRAASFDIRAISYCLTTGSDYFSGGGVRILPSSKKDPNNRHTFNISDVKCYVGDTEWKYKSMAKQPITAEPAVLDFDPKDMISNDHSKSTLPVSNGGTPHDSDIDLWNKILDKREDITTVKYSCHATIGFTLDGQTVVDVTANNDRDRLALLALVPKLSVKLDGR